MSVAPLFVGRGQPRSVLPLSIELANDGADTSGVIRVSNGTYQMDHPVELPTGARKRLNAYPAGELGTDITIILLTDRRRLVRTLSPLNMGIEPGSGSVLLIGDGEGDLGFVSAGERTANQLRDSYVSPELAPDRYQAYMGLAAIVLGAGAERMSAEAVEALKTYVLTGGTLLFLGGASAPTLSDRRWGALLPARPRLPKTIDSTPLVSNLYSPPPGPFTVLDAQPLGPARVEGGRPILVRRSFGLGRSLFLAFNPLERPFTLWGGRRSLFEKILRPVESDRAQGYLAGHQSSAYSYYYSGSGAYVGTTGGTGMPYAANFQDPFSTKLPPAEDVFLILAGFFVVVVPVNFLVLRKLKRAELAWLTAPLISIAFAASFFSAASNLYSAQLSRATSGVLIIQHGHDRAIFAGRSQLFFPRGGEYDLKLQSLESLGSGSPVDDYDPFASPQRHGGLADLQPIDDGSIQVSRMAVTNLSFRELMFRQSLKAPVRLETKLEGRRLEIANRGSVQLHGVSVIVAGASFPLAAELSPGKAAHLVLPAKLVPVEDPGYAPGGRGTSYEAAPANVAALTVRSKAVVIKASMPDLPVGPQIGRPVDYRQDRFLLYFTGLHHGEVEL